MKAELQLRRATETDLPTSSNTPARRCYERLGFAADGESKLENRRSYRLHELRYRRALGQ